MVRKTYYIRQSRISTNFNLADTSSGTYPCWRYTTVKDTLNSYLARDLITVDKLKVILRSVHAPGTSAYIGTAYTHIFNLNTLDMYIYILGNFDEVLKLNLAEELAKGTHSYRLTDDLIRNLSDTTTTNSHVSTGYNLLVIFLWLIPIVEWRRRKKLRN